MPQKGKDNPVWNVVNDIVNIAHEYKLPAMAPRSKWYGLYLTDYATLSGLFS